MLSLFRFLYRHAFIVYFLLLESIAFIFLLQDNPYQRASFLNSSDFIAARTYQAIDDVFSYLDLREENEQLSRENSELRSKLLGNYRKSFSNNIVLRDSSYEQEFVTYEARVINNSTGRLSNHLTIDKGARHGIEEGMGVVSKDGIIGIVVKTSPRFSSVMSVLNKDSRISVKIAKNGYFGSLVWPGNDYRIATLLDIPNHLSLLKGDLVVTSGFSSRFPEGVPVGRVHTVRRVAGSGFLEVEVEFTEDYRKIGYVHVVKNLHRMERQSLDTTFGEDD